MSETTPTWDDVLTLAIRLKSGEANVTDATDLVGRLWRRIEQLEAANRHLRADFIEAVETVARRHKEPKNVG